MTWRSWCIILHATYIWLLLHFKCMVVAAVRWRAFPHQCMIQRHTLSKHRQTLLCTLRPQQTYTATFFYIYVCVFVLLLYLFIPRVSRQSKLQIQFDYLERSSNVYSIVSRFYSKYKLRSFESSLGPFLHSNLKPMHHQQKILKTHPRWVEGI